MSANLSSEFLFNSTVIWSIRKNTRKIFAQRLKFELQLRSGGSKVSALTSHKHMNKFIVIAIVALVLNPIGACAQTTASISDQEFASGYDIFIRKTLERFPEIPSVAVV